PASVKYATTNGTASAPGDYTTASPTVLNFAANETSQTVTVPTTADGMGELNETFNLTLSAATNALISDASGTATVVDGDGNPPMFSIGDVTVPEGSPATFTITRSGDTSQMATVKYMTANGTATSPGDYAPVLLTQVTFNPGDVTKPFNVNTVNNSVDVT